MSQNSQNSQLDSSATVNPFALRSEDLQQADEDNADTIHVASNLNPTPGSRSGRPLRPSRKRQQHTSPPSPPPTLKRRTKSQANVDGLVLEALGRLKAALVRVEDRAIQAEKRVEELESTIKNLLKGQDSASPRPGPSVGPTPARLYADAPALRVPGLNLDISYASQLRDQNARELRKYVGKSLQASRLRFQYLGLNIKDKG
jgi:hypothetical protein